MRNNAEAGRIAIKCYYIRIARKFQNWPWKMIWKIKAPVKATCFGWLAARTYFGWLAARDACLIQNKLQRRNFPLCTRCYFCKNEETVEHLFLHCRFSR
ncbi:hypothetical protein RND71_036241 [Anisodus tanguticus]|uniref:Reverse transcriptase zinc-binding domain-containing protein n=1 Tax=Anisodus tanguticus TaxID=243964 RepID=A0AAE1R6J2_9SOLA|nr:hypothetical protein RND71_036241 [Anisodus tanguticus]